MKREDGGKRGGGELLARKGLLPHHGQVVHDPVTSRRHQAHVVQALLRQTAAQAKYDAWGMPRRVV